MLRATKTFLIAGALGALACGVPEQKYKAALADAEKATKDGQSQKERADAAEKRLADADQRAKELEEQLAKTRESLEGEKQAATAEAEQQRQRASQLEQEKRALEKKSAEYQALASSLDAQIKTGQIQLSELQGKLTVRMAEKILFPSGSATVSKEGQKTLATIGDALKDVKGRLIRVEGHTDNVPIKTAKFPSNWELSAARAIAVVRILQSRGVDPTLLGAAGYAEYQPIASNDTPEGRAQNRRIEISLAAPLSQVPTAGAGGQ
jgi:chemotaxis protein MotB